jgi:hypothetical protein
MRGLLQFPRCRAQLREKMKVRKTGAIALPNFSKS